MNKKPLVKIGKELEEAFQTKARGIFFKDIEHDYALEDADTIRESVYKLFKSIALEEAADELENLDSSYPAEYPQTASLDERKEWFLQKFYRLEDCAFCRVLPAKLSINVSRDERFPAPFYKLRHD